jgi:hypothetical protein
MEKKKKPVVRKLPEDFSAAIVSDDALESLGTVVSCAKLALAELDGMLRSHEQWEHERLRAEKLQNELGLVCRALLGTDTPIPTSIRSIVDEHDPSKWTRGDVIARGTSWILYDFVEYTNQGIFVKCRTGRKLNYCSIDSNWRRVRRAPN